jgi:hypothetical protein
MMACIFIIVADTKQEADSQVSRSVKVSSTDGKHARRHSLPVVAAVSLANYRLAPISLIYLRLHFSSSPIGISAKAMGAKTSLIPSLTSHVNAHFLPLLLRRSAFRHSMSDLSVKSSG